MTSFSICDRIVRALWLLAAACFFFFINRPVWCDWWVLSGIVVTSAGKRALIGVLLLVYYVCTGFNFSVYVLGTLCSMLVAFLDIFLLFYDVRQQ